MEENNNLQEKEEQYTVIREKIKARPINKGKLLKNGLITVLSAVAFGLIACLTFVILSPVFQKIFEPEETESTVPIVTFPVEPIDEEMNPEDMLTDEDVLEENAHETQKELPEEQIEDILSKVTFSLTDYQKLYYELSEIAKEAEKSLVRITPYSNEEDMFLNVYEGYGEDTGLIVAEADGRFFILCKSKSIKTSKEPVVTFVNDIRAQASVFAEDDKTGFTILAVSENSLNEVTRRSIKTATLGSSAARRLAGSPVIAVGSPMGNYGSVNYGMITSSNTPIYVTDNTYKKVDTDIYGSTSATGVLVNLTGEVIGVIDGSFSTSDAKNLISAVGITELKKTIEDMINHVEVPVFGINGTDVPKELSDIYSAPEGAFVIAVNMDSPAMKGGIQSGDIITSVDGVPISGMNGFNNSVRSAGKKTSVSVKVYRMVMDEYKPMELEIVLN
jgi:S1-C subfamily serine protease